ncbi:MAG: phosphoribosylformylglycinamidine cyclo-ligase [Candidatus Levybacteria bacterium]|nr:phosphoribosylformylglycinamidine cyclo-ligase [Candidatus Levybacteria bacterium]
MTNENRSITYASTGVNYDAMDPIKRFAQMAARTTSGNLRDLGFQELEASRGESAHVIDVGPFYLATVMEGLGTKNLVADAVRSDKEPSFYNKIAQDTVAMIVNDLVVVGARPMVVSAYWTAGSGDWFEDETRSRELAEGWANACNKAEAIYGGGETPTLKDIINPGTVDLAGSAVGIIQPKSRLTLGDRIAEGDRIILAPSSGIHANGLTLARRIALEIADGYNTRLSDGRTYGETLLQPTPIYAKLVRELFDAGVDIHYMVNVTGHGWRKLMRATKDYKYVIDAIPQVQPEFDFIKGHSGNTLEEMYGNFNMGAGFAFFVPEHAMERTLAIAKTRACINLLNAGVIEPGPKEVVINPVGVSFKGESLSVR